MPSWIRYNHSRAVWEISPHLSENVFSDLLENHPREVIFSRWLDFDAFADARAADTLWQPNDSLSSRRRRTYESIDVLRRFQGDYVLRTTRRRRTTGVLDSWGPGQINTPPPVSVAGRARLYFDKIGSKLVYSEQGRPFEAINRTLLVGGFGFSAGQGNGAGSVDTPLTSYDRILPANFLDQPGDALVLEGTLAVAANVGSKLLKIQIGGSGLITLLTNALNVVNHIIPFRYIIRRRTSVLGSITGIAYVGAAAGGNATPVLANAGVTSVDWTTQQTLALFANAPLANDYRLTDMYYMAARGKDGSIV